MYRSTQQIKILVISVVEYYQARMDSIEPAHEAAEPVTNKTHVLCVAFPAQGHLNPMMNLATLLHSRGFYITFVNTEFNHRRLIRSKGSEDWTKGLTDFRFETIPDGLPPSDRDATQDPPALCDSIRDNCLAPFRDLLIRINTSDSKVPPISCIISDGIMSFAMKAAEEFGIPEVQFWTASACGFLGYLQYPEFIRRRIVPFKDESFLKDGTLDSPIDWIPGLRNIRLKDIPSFVRTTDPNDILFNFMKDEAQDCLKASAIILHTFDALEDEALHAVSNMSPPIYTIGPLALLDKGITKTQPSSIFKPNLWKEDRDCLKWLDKQKDKSVVYISYGCVTLMSDQHLQEFAWGLANSQHPFLWNVRPDVVMGSSAILPDDFYEEIKDRGLLVKWCPQDEVLLHPSVGVFLTHCGWNSTLESICAGVPLICWPFFAEQQMNRRYCSTEWGIGLEVNEDVKRDEIEGLIKKMMETERGKEMMKRAQEWKKKAEEAADVGGSSHINFNRLIKEALCTCTTES